MTKVLVIDDEASVRRLLKTALGPHGLEIVEAESGKEGLYQAIALRPDAILLDWNMPVMSGIEFLEKLRQMPNGKNPKVVFCTTENDVGHIARAMDSGADEYVMKPFDAEIIRGKLQQIGML